MKNKCHICCRELSQLQHIKIWAQWTNGLSDTNKIRFDLDLHLHNQDGLIWTWCFYVIWLSGHTPYAHEIWAIYDEWLWRYEWSCENTKMAPRWRHGWVIRLKRLLYPFLIRAKILWKFENDCSFRFWDILNTKFIQRGKKRFVKTSLRAMNRRSRDRIGRNLVCEYFEMTIWIENLTMFPTSD